MSCGNLYWQNISWKSRNEDNHHSNSSHPPINISVYIVISQDTKSTLDLLNLKIKIKIDRFVYAHFVCNFRLLRITKERYNNSEENMTDVFYENGYAWSSSPSSYSLCFLRSNRLMTSTSSSYLSPMPIYYPMTCSVKHYFKQSRRKETMILDWSKIWVSSKKSKVNGRPWWRWVWEGDVC